MAFTNFEELTNSPTFDFSLESQKSKRVGKIPWSSVPDLLEELFPFGSIVSAAHPSYPIMRARSLSVVPFSGDNEIPTSPVSSDLTLSSVNEYAYAKATINYDYTPTSGEGDPQDPEPNPDPVTLLSHRWSIGGEYLKVPPTGFEWCDEGIVDPEQINVGILIPTIEHQISWPRVQYPPFSTIRSTIGKCNTTAISFATGVILPETLLFLGADLQRDILSTGALAWQVTYRFSERRVKAADDGCSPAGVTGDTTAGGWNHLYRSDDGFKTDDPKVGFYRIQGKTGHTGAGGKMYETAEFADLFYQATS